MKKLITFLMFTTLTISQSFAQPLQSGACDVEDPTCQAFEVPIEGEVLQDFVMTQNTALSLGKVRRGEQIDVVEGDNHRGKQTGFVTLQGALNQAYTITCIPASSVITYSDETTQTLDACTIQDSDLGGNFAASHAGESISDAGGKLYEVAASILIKSDAPNGDATGSVHLEVAYE